MNWKQVSKSYLGGAGTVTTEFDVAEGLYRVSLDEVAKGYSSNQAEAKKALADKLDRIAQELRR